MRLAAPASSYRRLTARTSTSKSKSFRPRSAQGRGTFDKRLKSTQKRWSPVIAPACGGSPAFLGPGGGRSTHALHLHSRASCAGAQTALAFPAALALRHTLPQSARPCNTRRLSRAQNPENTRTASVWRSCRSARRGRRSWQSISSRRLVF